MSYCPEHGGEMVVRSAPGTLAFYDCPDGEVWIYDGEHGTYQSLEAFQLESGEAEALEEMAT